MTEEEKKNLIAQKVDSFEKNYGTDSAAYRQAMESADSLEAIKAIDPKLYAGNKPDGQYEGGSSSYQFHQNEDGSYTALGNNGEKIQAKNFEELNDLTTKALKDGCLKDKKEPILAIHSPDADKSEVFVRAGILKHNITIGKSSDIPTDPKFWKNLKEEYFKNPEHKLSDWVKMTRFMPDDLLQRTNEEKKIRDDFFKSEQIKKLRQGVNPNLQGTQNKEKTQPQKISLNDLKRMRDLDGNAF